MEQKDLQQLGLSESEAKVYLALLELGSNTAGKIAKKTKLNRVSVYKGLEKLISKGLVSYVIQANKKHFQAVNPDKVKEMIERKEEDLEEMKNKLPLLKALYDSSKKEMLSEVYEGIKGGKTVWENYLRELKRGDEVLIVGAPKSAKFLGGYFKDWNKRRADKGARLKIIYNQDAKELIKVRKRQKLTEVRVMPKEYITPACFEVVKDKVIIIVYGPKLTLFQIESKEVANSFRQYFKILWKIGKK